MKNDVFCDAIRVLSGDEAPRVWSLIVTVFGDLAQAQGQSISGPVLGDILAPLGVRPETMRVALHRLRAEGWIKTTKRGREALHQLTREGREKSATATQHIYARDMPASGEWHVLCFPAATSADEQARATHFGVQGYTPLASGVYLANGAAKLAPKDALVVTGHIDAIPDWIGAALVPPSLRSGLKDLTAALDLAYDDTDQYRGAEPMQIAALRTLIVHRWRRLILRSPFVPDVIFGRDWEGALCRTAVMTALDALPKPEASLLV